MPRATLPSACGAPAAGVVQSATWQRCRVHFMRNVLEARRPTGAGASSLPSSPRRLSRTMLQRRAQWRVIADQFRPKAPKLAALMDGAEPDALAYVTFPSSTGPSSLDQSAGAADRREQAAYRGDRHLPPTRRRSGLWCVCRKRRIKSSFPNLRPSGSYTTKPDANHVARQQSAWLWGSHMSGSRF
jgi:hypothetical protein